MSENAKFAKHVVLKILIPGVLLFGVIYGISLLIEHEVGGELGYLAGALSIVVMCTLLTIVVSVYELTKR